jgi:integrating conjugative element protein (TIGR03749 family)
MTDTSRLPLVLLVALSLAAPARAADGAATPSADPVVLAADPQSPTNAGAAGAPLTNTTATPGATPTPPSAIESALPSAPTAAGAVSAGVRRPAEPARTSAPKAPAVRSATAGNADHRTWDRTPIRVQLAVNQERILLLPMPMRLGIPAILGASLRSQVLGRTTYLTALMPFEATRVVAESVETGQAILLDIGASTKADASAARPIEVHFPSPTETAEVSPALAEPVIDPVMLSRFAAKQIYAPRRLTTAVDGIHQVALDRLPVPHLYRGARLGAEPLASWRGGDFYVTAVRLINRASQPYELDPRQIDGRWHAVTFQNVRLGPAGSGYDTTAVYLVSDRPFAESL